MWLLYLGSIGATEVVAKRYYVELDSLSLNSGCHYQLCELG